MVSMTDQKIDFKKVNKPLVGYISESKKEPKWMLEKRLRALEFYNTKSMPKWGPNLSGLDLNNIIYYSDPEAPESTKWAEVPKEISDTFEKLGIPKAERDYLGGVGAQYDYGVVYHNLKKELTKKKELFLRTWM